MDFKELITIAASLCSILSFIISTAALVLIVKITKISNSQQSNNEISGTNTTITAGNYNARQE